jgi:hypothetical protein
MSESSKSLEQRILEKGAVSFALGMFVLLIALGIGMVTRLIIRRDLGLLGFWLNQVFLIMLFCIDKRPEEEGRTQRMDKFDSFELLTLGCQILPMLYAWRSGGASTYYGLAIMISMQIGLKVCLMFGLGKIVDISL